MWRARAMDRIRGVWRWMLTQCSIGIFPEFYAVKANLTEWSKSLLDIDHASHYVHMRHMRYLMIDLKSETGMDVLSGAIPGRQQFGRFLQQVPTDTSLQKLFLVNFEGIRVATSSYLRESILAMRAHLRAQKSKLHLVPVNLSEEVLEELSDLMKNTHDAIVVGSANSMGEPNSPRLLGDLDPKQRHTFEFVQQNNDGVDARQLMLSSEDINSIKSPTAWNNRLSNLADRGLLIEEAVGRSKRYRPLIEGDLRYGR